MKQTLEECLDNLHEIAATKYEVDQDTGELKMIDCTNMNKYIEMIDPLLYMIYNQFTRQEIDWIRLKTLGLDKTNEYCLKWNDKEIRNIERFIDAKLTMQEELQ